MREFEVAEVDGRWRIPSKQDYPADATRQMAQAATCVINRKILRVAGGAEEHEDLGVVDPLSAKLDSKSQGVGTRVIMSDSGDKELVDMIIGKPVKDAPGQRYVRRSNQDVVYVVELDPTNLSTDFNDWIEKDLLKINPFDISKLFVNDYSADLGFVLTPQGIRSRVNWDRRNEMTLGYDNADAKWQLADVKKFDPQAKEMVEDKIADDEEVDQDSLGKLRSALDDLAIVDVVKKPEGLSADLKAGEDFLKNDQAFEDLISKGFSPVAIGGAEPEILSSEGEVVCTLRDGVEYVLRFGQLQVQTESAGGADEAAAEPTDPTHAAQAAEGKAPDASKEPAGGKEDAANPAEKKDAAKPADDKAKKDGENLRRYLFVMARFNQDSIEKPKLKDLPALPEGATQTSADKPADAAAAPAADAAAAPADAETPAADAEKKDEPPATDQAKPEDKSADLEKAIAERKSIEAENQRQLDDYQEKIKTGQKKVADLNERFGDWYYVISNDVYKQIHLGRDKVIHKKAKPEDKAAGKPAAPGGANDALSGLPDLPAAAPAAAPAEQPAPQSAPATEGQPDAESQPEAAPAKAPAASAAATEGEQK